MLFSDALLLGSTTVKELVPSFFYWEGVPRTATPNCGCAIGTALIAVGRVPDAFPNMEAISQAIKVWPYLRHPLQASFITARFPRMANYASIYDIDVMSLAQWISSLHSFEVAGRLELAEWVAGLEREWGIVDTAPESTTEQPELVAQP